ncbi:MAG: DoxX family protein [Bacteroidia bacterium]
MNKSLNSILWIFKFLAAVILLQTLYFKFTAHPDSVYIFKTLGVEPFGRVGAGISELIASILILVPKTSFYGALMGMGIMIGALLSHIFVLGIDVNNDGGLLFSLGVITFISCLIVAGITYYSNKIKSIHNAN